MFGDSYRGSRELPDGLLYQRDFVNSEEEAQVLAAVDKGPWSRRIRRAQQFFGLVYYQTTHSVPELQPTGDSGDEQRLGRPMEEFPGWLLRRVAETGIFESGAGEINQVQANEYLGDSGIGVHVEDPAAGPAFATLSFLEPVQMTLAHAPGGRPVAAKERDRHDFIKVLLEPRSLLVFRGESRYNFSHAIRQSRLVHLPGGSTLRRTEDYRRVSLTFRGILKDERTRERQDTPDNYRHYVVGQSGR